MLFTIKAVTYLTLTNVTGDLYDEKHFLGVSVRIQKKRF